MLLIDEFTKLRDCFLAQLLECLVMRVRACFWAFFLMVSNSKIHSSSGGFVGGKGIVM